MHERTKEFLLSLPKEEMIEYIDNMLKKRDEKEASLINENKILKEKIAVIQKIVGGNTKIPQTLMTVIAGRSFGKEW